MALAKSLQILEFKSKYFSNPFLNKHQTTEIEVFIPKTTKEG